jgi:hypothetical protein
LGGNIFDQVAQEAAQKVASPQPQTPPSTQAPTQAPQTGNIFDQVASEHQQAQQKTTDTGAGTDSGHGSTYNYLHGLYQNTAKPVVDLAANLPGDMLSYYYQKADEKGGTGTLAGNLNAIQHVANGGIDTTLLDKLHAHPKDSAQILKDAAKDPEHPIAKIVSGIVQSHIQTAQKAWEQQKAAYVATKQAVDAANRGDYVAAEAAARQAALAQTSTFGYAGATALPILGPAAANAGEDIGSGHAAEGLGKGTGLIASVLAPHAPEAIKKLPDAVTHVYDTTLGRIVPREQLPLTMKEPYIHNPEASAAAEGAATGISTKTPISQVSPEASRAITGSYIQKVAEEVKNLAGEDAGNVATAAKTAPISEVPSEGFTTDVRKLSSEAKGLSIDPADEFSKIQKMSDDIAENPPKTHEEFDQAKAKIGARLNEKNLTPQQTRLYGNLRRTLQDEYYGRLDEVNPALADDLKSANNEYHDQINRLENGAAKTLFDKNAPEDVIKNLASQGVKESAAHDLMKSMREADSLDLDLDQHVKGTEKVAPQGYVAAVRNSVLKQQMEEFATRRNADGNPVQVDAQKWLNRFEKNAAANHEIFDVVDENGKVHPDEYDFIRDDLKAMAKRQYRVARNQGIATKLAVTAGAGLAGTWILHSLLGAPAPAATSPAE